MKIKINWKRVLTTVGIAALGAVSAIWQAHSDQELMEETVAETIRQLTENSDESQK